jgi:acetoin utilization deacetylase AcuC-like enzyme
MQVTGDGYAAMAAIVRHLADELCGGRLAFVLEGGYALSGVREGTAAVLDAIIDPEAPNLPPVADLDPGSPLERIVEQAVQVHRRHFPDLGSA